MAGERNTVQVVVTAKDEASGTLNEFIRNLDRMGREGQKAGAGIRNLVQPLAYELAPALGSTGGAMARLVGSAAAMTTGFGGLALVATSLAGIVGGKLLESWQKAREEQEKWAKAFASGDASRMTAAINAQADAVRKLGEEYRKATEFQSAIDPRIERQLRGPGSPGAQARGAATALEEARLKLAAGQRARELGDFTRGLEEAEGPGVVAVNAQQEQARIDKIKEAMREAARLEQARLDRIKALDLARFGGGDYGGDESLAFLGGKPLSQVVSEQEESPVIQAMRRNILEGFGAGPEETPVAETQEALEKLSKQRLETAKEEAELRDRILQTDVDRAAILLNQTGLTREQTNFLSEQLEAAREIAIQSSSTLIDEEKKVQLLQLQVEHSNRLRKNLEEENALAGLAAGFKDVADEAELAGKTMRRFAQETARSMQQSFSDLFFNVMTGNFKSLEDVGKNFGLSVARSLSDALATGVSGQITGLFGAGTQAAQSFFGSAAQGGMTQGQIAAFQASGGVVTGGQTGGLLEGLGTGGLLSGIFGSSSSSPGPSRSFIDAEAGSPGSAESVGGNIGGGGGGGFGLSAGGIASLAVLAASIGYGASQKGGSPSGQSRALGGALTGAQIGGAIYPGYGHAIGAIVGLFAGVATADAKDRNEAEARHRGDAYNVGRFQPRLQNDVARVQAAQNYQDLAVAVRYAMHEAYGGGAVGSKDGLAGFACWIGGGQIILPGGSFPTTMTLDDLASLLETDGDSFQAQLQLGIAEHARRQLGQIFEQAVKDQAALIGRFNATPFAYEDVGPGIRRTTILPAGALATADVSGHALMVDRLAAANLGLTDAQMDNFIRQFADRNTQTDRIPDFTAELRLQL